MIKIAPSILSANFANLLPDVEDAARGGADWLHVDVMDGHFVPNITIGIPVVASLRRATNLFLDVHLMIDRPIRYVRDFCRAGADLVTLHVEADQPQNISEAISLIRAEGKMVGLSLKPRTPAEVLIPYLPELDLVLVMTVEPGFGGQSFMSDQLDKIRQIKGMIETGGKPCHLEVDGGVDVHTAPLVKFAGADVLVAGSAVFGKEDRAGAIAAIREA
jgi:ribulose-phosphate 3-epimerase